MLVSNLQRYWKEFLAKSSSTVSVLVVAPLYPPPLDTVAQPTPPLTENSHWNRIVDPSSLIPATGPKETVPPDPASILAVSYTHLTLPTKRIV